jgi:hypothetical protein
MGVESMGIEDQAWHTIALVLLAAISLTLVVALFLGVGLSRTPRPRGPDERE